MKTLAVGRDEAFAGEGGTCPKCGVGGVHSIGPMGLLANDPAMMAQRMECGQCDHEWWDLVPEPEKVFDDRRQQTARTTLQR